MSALPFWEGFAFSDAASASFPSNSCSSSLNSSHSASSSHEDFTPSHTSNALALEDSVGGAGDLVINLDAPFLWVGG